MNSRRGKPPCRPTNRLNSLASIDGEYIADVITDYKTFKAKQATPTPAPTPVKQDAPIASDSLQQQRNRRIRRTRRRPDG